MSSLGGIRELLASVVKRFSRPVPANVTPHFIPLDLESIKNTVESDISSRIPVSLVGGAPVRPKLDGLRAGILRFVNSSIPYKIVLTQGRAIVVGEKSKHIAIDVIVGKFTPAAVYRDSVSNDNLLGVLYGSLNKAQADFFEGFLNREMTSFLDKSAKAMFGAGVVSRDPIIKELTRLNNSVNSISATSVNIVGVPASHNKASLLQTAVIVQSLMTQHARTADPAPMVNVTVVKELSGFINKINAQIIIVQEETEPSGVANEISSGVTSGRFGQLLSSLKVAGSDLLSDISAKIIRVFSLGTNSKGELKGDVIPSMQEHTRRSGAVMTPIESTKRTTVSITTGKGSTGKVDLPTQTAVSTTSLAALINSKLHDEIQSRMGSGEREDILNYRTGRLAHSAKVTTVSQTRTGALTAFFTYMRYPYGTFSEAGAQQFPRSRDPSTLIQASIRAIATKQMIHNLRTVLV